MSISDNNTLFITYYTEEDYDLFPNILNQISKQTIKADLLNIFFRCEEISECYLRYYEKNNFTNDCYFQYYPNKSSNTIKDHLKTHIHKYTNFIFLDPKHLLDNNFLDTLQQSNLDNHKYSIVNPYNKNIPILYFDKLGMIEILRQNYTSESLRAHSYLNNEISVVSFKDIPIIKNNINDIEKTVYYENDLFTLCKLLEDDNKDIFLVDSYIYINKRNNKIYNIANNITGELESSDNFVLLINWLKDDKMFKRAYRIDMNTKTYININLAK